MTLARPHVLSIAPEGSGPCVLCGLREPRATSSHKINSVQHACEIRPAKPTFDA